MAPPTPPEGFFLDGPLPTDQLRHAIEQKWIEAGATPQAAEGIVRRAYKESRLDPYAIGDNGTSVGIYQEHGPRAAALQNYAKQHGLSVVDPLVQTDFAISEAKGGDRLAARHWRAISEAQTPEAGELAFTNYFERPKVSSRAKPASPVLGDEMVPNSLPAPSPVRPITDVGGGGGGVIVTKPTPPIESGRIVVRGPSGLRMAPYSTIESALAKILRTR